MISILDKAKEIIYGDREKTYGTPDKNLKTIAELWSSYIQNIGRNVLTTDDVCLMMVLLKVARLANSPEHKDSQIDAAGYMALMERVQDFNALTKPNPVPTGHPE